MLEDILAGLKNIYSLLNDIRSYKDYMNNIFEIKKNTANCIMDLETYINKNSKISKLNNTKTFRYSYSSINPIKNFNCESTQNKVFSKKIEKIKPSIIDNDDRLISDLEAFSDQEPKEKIKINDKLKNYIKEMNDYKKICSNNNFKNNKYKIPNGNPNIKNKTSACVNYPENIMRLKLFSHRKTNTNLNHNNSCADNKLSDRINKINEIIKIINIDKSLSEKLKNLYGNQIIDQLFRFNINDTLLNNVYECIKEIRITKYNNKNNYSFHHKSRNKGGLINDLLLKNYNTESFKSNKNIKKEIKSRNKGIFELSKKGSFEGSNISQYQNGIISEYLTLNSNHNYSFNK